MGLSRIISACAALALVAFSAPASAVTITPGGGPYALTAPNSYTTGVQAIAGPTNHVYTFTSTGALNALSVTTNVPQPNGSGLTLDWLEDGFSVIGGPQAVTAASTAINLVVNSGIHIYQLILASAFASPSAYTTTITTTPLPASLVLFGSVVAGGLTIMRRRKKAAALASA